MIFLLTVAVWALMILPDIYIYRRYVRKASSRPLKCLYWLPAAVLTLFLCLMPLVMRFADRDAIKDVTVGFFLVFLVISIPKLVFTLCSILSGLLRTGVYGLVFSIAAGLFTMGYVLYGIVEGTHHFRLRSLSIAFDSLPKGFDGFRIVHISDIHTGNWSGREKYLEEAVDIVNSQDADIVLITGDLVNNLASETDEFMPLLKRLKSRYGTYSVLGNHDYGTYVRWDSEADRERNLKSLIAKQEEMGWTMLNNDNRILYCKGDSIMLAGVENMGKPPFLDRGDLDRALKGSEGLFCILMSHDPSSWRERVVGKTDVQLTLSGHTHDMQVNIFGFSPSYFLYPEHNGLYKADGQALFVNIGLGYVVPIRLGAWPEITVLELKCE